MREGGGRAWRREEGSRYALEAEGARFDNRPDVGLREKELSRPWFQLAGGQRSG